MNFLSVLFGALAAPVRKKLAKRRERRQHLEDLADIGALYVITRFRESKGRTRAQHDALMKELNEKARQFSEMRAQG